MSNKTIKLTESQLIEIIEKVLSETEVKEDLGGMDDSHPIYGEMNPDDLLKYVRSGDIRIKKVKSNKFEDEEEMLDDPSKDEEMKMRMEKQHQFESRKRK